MAFYQDVLGFENPWFWGDPVTFGGIGLGDIQLMFNRQPEIAARIEGHQHHFFAERIDELHARHVERGANVIEPIGNKPWGLREYTVRDPNGYHLRFGGPKSYEKPPTARDTLPAHIHIENRLATVEEYAELTRSVKWTDSAKHREGLSRSILGVVAIDARDNRVVGMARAMEDAPAWYSIWDVVVHPAHQSQRIGTAMLEALMQALRQRGPAGAWVFLFTFSPGFYARLGFKDGTCTMCRL